MSRRQSKKRSSDEAGFDGPASKHLKTSHSHDGVHIKLEVDAAGAKKLGTCSDALPELPPSDHPHPAEAISRVSTKKRYIENAGRHEPSRKKQKPSEPQLAVFAPSRKAKGLSAQRPQQLVGTTVARVPRSRRNIARSMTRSGRSTPHFSFPPQPEHTYQSSSSTTFNYIGCSTHHHFYGPTIHQYHGSSASNSYDPRDPNHNGDFVHFHGPSMHLHHVPPATVHHNPSTYFHGPSLHIYRAPSALDHQDSSSSNHFDHSASNHRDWQHNLALDEHLLDQRTPYESSFLGPRGRVTEVSSIDEDTADDTQPSRTIMNPSVAPLAASPTSSTHKSHPDTESKPTKSKTHFTRNKPPPTKVAPRRTSDRLKRKTPPPEDSTTVKPNDPPSIRPSKQKKRKLAASF
jgi:hypothetical protein